MKTKLMLITLTVILGAALIGGATFAWFTDEAEVADNVIIAGDLKLDVERVHDNPGPGLSYVFDNIQPGDKAGNWGTTEGMTELSWIVKNDGSIDGDLTMKIDDVEGSLAMQIRPQYWVRDHGGWKWESGSIVEGNICNIELDAGETARLDVTWSFHNTAGNEFQGDQVKFDTVFELNQRQ